MLQVSLSWNFLINPFEEKAFFKQNGGSFAYKGTTELELYTELNQSTS